MDSTIKKFLRSKSLCVLICFTLLFGIFKFIIDCSALSSLSFVDIDIVADEESYVKVYYWNGVGRLKYSEKKSIKRHYFSGGSQSVSINMRNKIVKKLKIDFGNKPVTLYIKRLTLRSNFGNDLSFAGTSLTRILAGGSNTTVQNSASGTLITGLGEDTCVYVEQPVVMENYFLAFVLPVLLSVVVLLLWDNISFRSIPAFSDIVNKTPSSGTTIAQLDGLRGFAAILVLADHTGAQYFKGLGALGVWLFFVLSGFLLSRPFVEQPALGASASYLRGYFLRRLKRILPMFYVYITVFFLFHGMHEKFLRHLLFIQGDRILWSIPQEVYFYMLLPLIMSVNYFIFKGRNNFIVIFLLFFSWVLNCYFDANVISIYGNGKKLPLWAGVFFVGVVFSYLFYGVKVQRFLTIPIWLISLLGFLLLSIIFLSSDKILHSMLDSNIYYTWKYFGWYSYLMGFLLYLVVISDKTLLSRLLSWYPLRAVGLVGFSFYLLHTESINIIRLICNDFLGYRIEGMPLLITAIIVTYSFSVFTYSYIERPFLKIKM